MAVRIACLHCHKENRYTEEELRGSEVGQRETLPGVPVKHEYRVTCRFCFHTFKFAREEKAGHERSG